MKPVLFDPDEKNFKSQGLGTLSDCISCKVTEERNGMFELEMQYPADGIHFEDIRHSSVIKASPGDARADQLFRVYKITEPLNGVCTINAEHISYQLNYIPVLPFNAYGASGAFQGFKTYNTVDNPFTFWTDINSNAEYTQEAPESIRSRLGGQEGSVLDVFGGEYEWDNYTVRLHRKRGTDRNVTLRYGKNITDITQEENIEETYTGICPYWCGQTIDNDANDRLAAKISALEESVVSLNRIVEQRKEEAEEAKKAYNTAKSKYGAKNTKTKKKKTALDEANEELAKAELQLEATLQSIESLNEEKRSVEGTMLDVVISLPEKVLYAEGAEQFPFERIRPVDFSNEFEDVPTVEALRKVATAWMNASGIGKPSINVKVSFVALWNTEEYRDVAPLERVQLCDTVVVEFERLGISTAAKVIKTVYNVLLERYESIELGDARNTLSSNIASGNLLVMEAIGTKPTNSTIRAEVKRAMELIQGGYGGYVVFRTNANGQPEEMLILDSGSGGDISKARNVVRLNQNGIGFSKTGFEGPYTTAWTIDAAFVADFIAAGTIADKAGKSYWNMDTGEMKLVVNSFSLSNGDTIQSIATSAASSAASSAVASYDSTLNQLAIFNKLTNNGQTHGIYLENGKLYINGEYIKSGQIEGRSIISYWADGWSSKTSPNTTNRYLNGRLISTDTWVAYIKAPGAAAPKMIPYGDVVMSKGGIHFFVKGTNQETGSITSETFYYQGSYRTDDSQLTIYGDVAIDLEAPTLQLGNENTYVYSPGVYSATNTSAANVRVTTGDVHGHLCRVSSSSRRYKRDIKDIQSEELKPQRLYDLPVRQFIYNDGYIQESDQRYHMPIPGLIAEEVFNVYPIAADLEGDEVEDWNFRYIIPPMLALIQEQHKEIEALKHRNAEFEERLSRLEALVKEA